MTDIKERFYSSLKESSFLEHLDDRDDVFWQSLNYLEMFNDEKFDEENSYFYHARIFITGRLINHILATYQLLKMGLEDESKIMLRQSLELSWLLKYFINNPTRVNDWVIRNKMRISPYERREAVDNNTISQKIYSNLNDIVHSNSNSFWGSFVGGMHNSWITDKLFGHLLILIYDVIGYFEEIVLLFNISISNNNLLKKKEELLQNVGIAIYETSYLQNPESTIKRLIELGEEDVIRYIEDRFEIVE
ncbi:hypothetical protein EXW96_25780 [Paenibacillus sp. JMULE4]|uniref:hypothetical protein n=1 Tax=Paenibacillus sp. JMULE4 TaxID=2518342 RepID=UPI0015750516|nr:hypothetical protein [Paenibacillus sp. JMULE4]NTZ20803.1 hypothetical protein [Paenibacillus sp. JMULE4]